MLKREDVIPFLKEYCKQNKIDFDIAYDQIRVASLDYVGLYVSDPKAPEPNCLANDRETMMLPTLFIHSKNGQFYAEETPFTEEFLKNRTIESPQESGSPAVEESVITYKELTDEQVKEILSDLSPADQSLVDHYRSQGRTDKQIAEIMYYF